jgi:serine/threonine-protein kinase
MLGLTWIAAGDAFLTAAVLWLVYLAIEPAVRARYPHSIITWNRLLVGRWLDAQVAGDVLIGGAVGCLLWVVAALMDNAREGLQTGGNLFAFLGARQFLARHASVAADALGYGLLVFAVICFMRRLVRYDLPAAVLTALIFTITEGDVANSSNVTFTVALFIAIYAILAFVLMRIGLVATIAAIFFINCFSAIWLGGDWTAWYAPYGIAAIVIALSIALVAFWKSLGSTDLLGAEEG